MPEINATLDLGNLKLSVCGCKSEKDVFEALSFWASDWQAKCSCGSTRVMPQGRESQGYKFYEGKCLDCGNVFQYGQKREGGGLFPKRDAGWHQPQRNDQQHDDRGNDRQQYRDQGQQRQGNQQHGGRNNGGW